MNTCKSAPVKDTGKASTGRIVLHNLSGKNGSDAFLVTYERDGKEPIVLKRMVNCSEAKTLAESAQVLLKRGSFGDTNAAALFESPCRSLWATEQTAALYVLFNNLEARKQVSKTLTALSRCEEEIQSDLLQTVYFNGSSHILKGMDSKDLAATIKRVSATRDQHLGLTALVLEYVACKMDPSLERSEVDWVQLASAH
ncbi:MAG: hypothetical protein U5N86_00560 [Planctomycetota bacterium]|nr:hypothetical protein [Planctomycetota bacterium]